jgi:hypothetical protein
VRHVNDLSRCIHYSCKGLHSTSDGQYVDALRYIGYAFPDFSAAVPGFRSPFRPNPNTNRLRTGNVIASSRNADRLRPEYAIFPAVPLENLQNCYPVDTPILGINPLVDPVARFLLPRPSPVRAESQRQLVYWCFAPFLAGDANHCRLRLSHRLVTPVSMEF